MDNKHIIQFEGVRFFAVLMVMIAHWLQWQWTNPFFSKIPFIHGVTVFFVLSGFLITKILILNKNRYISEGKSKLVLIRQFYLRRFLRIFPIYYLLIIFLFAFNYNNTRELFPWLVTYSTNIYQSIYNVYIGDFSHFWSLAVEEQFYLFWPFVILFTKPNKIFFVILLTIIISLIIQFYLYIFIGKWMITSYFTLCCMYSLGIGALLAYLKIYNERLTSILSKPVFLYSTFGFYISSVIILNMYDITFPKEIYDNIFLSILSFFIILRASENGFKGIFKKILENKFVTYSGKISYGLYVYHVFVSSLFFFVAPKIGLPTSNKYISFVILYLITFFVSHVSWKLIEQPINKIKEKVPYD